MSSDDLQVETPEQVTLEFPIAGIGSRGLAILLDTLIAGIVMMVGFFVLVVVLILLATRVRFAPTNTWVLALAVIVVFLLQWGYFSLFEIFWRGQTPGKRVMKLRVIARTGGALTPFAALTRNFLRAVDVLPGMYGVGIICMICNNQAQRLGDIAAGTVVVHERRTVLPDLAPAATFSPGLPAAPVLAHALNLSDLELIETFLQRRSELPPEVRAATAGRIAGHLQLRGVSALPASDQLEAWLEALARDIRQNAALR